MLKDEWGRKIWLWILGVIIFAEGLYLPFAPSAFVNVRPYIVFFSAILAFAYVWRQK